MPPASEIEFVVKVCGITNEADARAAAEAGANAIGLNFYAKSPRFITPDSARLIASALPASVLKVGVFVNATAESIIAIAEHVALDAVQIHGTVSGGLTNLRIWRALPVDEEFPGSLNGALDAEAFLLDAPTRDFGGSGRTFDWSRVSGVRHRVVLAGGLDANNVAEAIAVAHPWGVDACSRLESSPGKKDSRKLRDFVAEALRARAASACLLQSESLEQELLS